MNTSYTADGDAGPGEPGTAVGDRPPRTTSVALYAPVPILDLYVVWSGEQNPLMEAFLGCLPSPLT